MSKYPALFLHHNKAHAVRRFHPWVFSGAVKRKEGNPDQGDIVEVYSENGEYLGIGHFGTGSVSVRIFAFEKVEDLNELWRKRFISAFDLRKAAGLARNPNTNAYRLINAEGDGMPGLIVDYYNGTAVIQAHSKGMHRERDYFVEILKQGYAEKLKAVYDKSSATLHHKPDTETKDAANNDSYLFGQASETIIKENGNQFYVNWELGQKTGFFLDQRDNRQLLARYAPGKNVLNTFCYSGGFSVYAAHAGAALVHSVDSSAKAVKWADENIALNAPGTEHKSFAADVFDFMKDADTNYDVIVLDPPAFAKGQSARHAAIKAYTRLNHEAFKKIKKGGIVFTFSCSQVVDTEMFTGAVTSAAIESGRNIRVLHHLTQPADHPVSIFNPEGLYLKGLVLSVE
jgi:23S rRNA (cytosine1962-C5)-methyltransferase